MIITFIWISMHFILDVFAQREVTRWIAMWYAHFLMAMSKQKVVMVQLSCTHSSSSWQTFCNVRTITFHYPWSWWAFNEAVGIKYWLLRPLIKELINDNFLLCSRIFQWLDWKKRLWSMGKWECNIFYMNMSNRRRVESVVIRKNCSLYRKEVVECRNHSCCSSFNLL